MSCRASVSSLASGSANQLANKMPEASALSQESLSETESPTLAAYPRSVYLQLFSPHSNFKNHLAAMVSPVSICSRKKRGASKLKLLRKSAVKLADDLGRKSGYQGGLTGASLPNHGVSW